jgi:hypothetical protein
MDFGFFFGGGWVTTIPPKYHDHNFLPWALFHMAQALLTETLLLIEIHEILVLL